MLPQERCKIMVQRSLPMALRKWNSCHGMPHHKPNCKLIMMLGENSCVYVRLCVCLFVLCMYVYEWLGDSGKLARIAE